MSKIIQKFEILVFFNGFLVLIWFNSPVNKRKQYSMTFLLRYDFIPMNFEKKMWNLEKIENCQISIFLYIIFFLWIIILILVWLLLIMIFYYSEVKVVFLKPSSLVWHNRYLKICFFNFDLSLFFFDFLLEITDSQRN